MTADHSRDLANAYPQLLGRLVTLGQAAERVEGERVESERRHGDIVGTLVGSQRAADVLNGSNRWDILDPARRSVSRQRAVAVQIVELCERLVLGWPG
jgi:hypothetical protein